MAEICLQVGIRRPDLVSSITATCPTITPPSKAKRQTGLGFVSRLAGGPSADPDAAVAEAMKQLPRVVGVKFQTSKERSVEWKYVQQKVSAHVRKGVQQGWNNMSGSLKMVFKITFHNATLQKCTGSITTGNIGPNTIV